MQSQDTNRCPGCLFCEMTGPGRVRCSNADLATENGGEETYLEQGYLDIPLGDLADRSCFWFLPRR
jgi:hypothetical protein